MPQNTGLLLLGDRLSALRPAVIVPVVVMLALSVVLELPAGIVNVGQLVKLTVGPPVRFKVPLIPPV